MDCVIQERVRDEIQTSGYMIEVFCSIMDGGVSQTQGILQGERHFNHRAGCVNDAFRFHLVQRMMESTNNWSMYTFY
jgi:hypothetical protein